MEEEIKKLIEEIITQTKANVQELVKTGNIEIAARSIGILTEVYLKLLKDEG